ncbi:hypothetical protein [Legionella gratiana]|nr:hypothetical protein [Legionella gratiana]
MSGNSELSPLDVQLLKEDEINEVYENLNKKSIANASLYDHK